MTQSLSAIDSGDPEAAEELLPLDYDELRRLAAHRLAGERSQHILLTNGPGPRSLAQDPSILFTGKVRLF